MTLRSTTRASSQHVVWLADHGCRGIVALGSLGEAQTLAFEEKISILETCKRRARRSDSARGGHRRTEHGRVRRAREARRARSGCDGLMVLPPYVYKGDWRESKAHFEAVISRDAALVHAVQQSDRLRDRRLAAADARAVARTRICTR